MSNPTIDDVASMSGEDFADFASNFDPSQIEEGSSVPEPANEPQEEQEEDEPVEQDSIEEGEEPEEEDEDSTDSSEMSPEDFYAALVVPMKANGKEVSFTDPEEIRTLVQKGIGYEQRMGKLKKFQRHMETLDKENLMNDDTLNLIIDLARGKPEALKAYVENNKIDIYDVIGLDTDNYAPEKHIPSEEEYTQSQVQQEVKSLPDYDLIKPIVESDWDIESQNKLLADPALATNLIEAAKAGIHDMVLAEAEKVKLLASQPMSDLDAYFVAGNKLHAKGAFDKISKKTSNVDENIKPKNIATNGKKSTRSTGAPSMADIAKMSPEQLRQFAAKHDL